MVLFFFFGTPNRTILEQIYTTHTLIPQRAIVMKKLDLNGIRVGLILGHHLVELFIVLVRRVFFLCCHNVLLFCYFILSPQKG